MEWLKYENWRTKSLIWEYQPLNKCGSLMVLEQGTAMAVSKII